MGPTLREGGSLEEQGRVACLAFSLCTLAQLALFDREKRPRPFPPELAHESAIHHGLSGSRSISLSLRRSTLIAAAQSGSQVIKEHIYPMLMNNNRLSGKR